MQMCRRKSQPGLGQAKSQDLGQSQDRLGLDQDALHDHMQVVSLVSRQQNMQMDGYVQKFNCLYTSQSTSPVQRLLTLHSNQENSLQSCAYDQSSEWCVHILFNISKIYVVLSKAVTFQWAVYLWEIHVNPPYHSSVPTGKQVTYMYMYHAKFSGFQLYIAAGISYSRHTSTESTSQKLLNNSTRTCTCIYIINKYNMNVTYI